MPIALERLVLSASLDPADSFESLRERIGGRGLLLERDGAVFIGLSPFETLRVRGGRAWSETGRRRVALPGPAFAALGRRADELRARGPMSALSCGMGGWLGYEMARHLERLPLACDGDEAVVMAFGASLSWDRSTGRLELYVAGPRPFGRVDALRRLEALRAGLRPAREYRSPIPKLAIPALEGAALGRARYLAGVRELKERIGAGDIFQAVLSDGFKTKTKASAGRIYRCLAAAGSSPYLFWLDDGERSLLGASPERLVRVVRGAALNYPIAGTRPRGATAAADRRLARALRKSPKERAEHMMLVDLGRNDLGRVCAPGTVRVNELMGVRRFPNVMHLVSELEGRLERGRTAWDALAASFPAGTVSGAPKVRAMELLAGLERRPRGFYAGAIVQQDFSGNLDSCIAIRTLELRRGWARLRAGAGIVADSRPKTEWDEIVHKLGGLRRALALAESGWSC